MFSEANTIYPFSYNGKNDKGEATQFIKKPTLGAGVIITAGATEETATQIQDVAAFGFAQHYIQIEFEVPTCDHTNTTTSEEIITDATCTEAGSKKVTVTCECGEVISEEIVEIAATGHINTTTTETEVKATCTVDGSKTTTVTCACGEVVSETTEVIKAEGHQEKILEAVACTCTATGLTEGKQCTVCNEITVEQEVVAAAGHKEVTVPGKAATCTATGLTDGVECSVCNTVLTEQEEIAAKGHTEKTDVETKAATCTEAGYTKTTVTCTVCGETISETTEEIKALGHTEENIPGKAATCTETGLTAGKKCSVCGEILVAQEEIKALGHTEAEAVIENFVDSTLNSKGSYDSVVYCSVCNAELKRKTFVIDEKTGATAEANGVKYYTLAEAIAAGGEVKLLADATADFLIKVTNGQEMILDLNGYTITAEANRYYIISVEAGGKLTINGEGGIINNNAYGYAIVNKGELIVNGGNIVGDYALYNGDFGLTAKATLNGGTFSANDGAFYSVANCSELIVNGATLNDWVNTSAKFTVESGKIENLYVGVADKAVASGVATAINGGEVEALYVENDTCPVTKGEGAVVEAPEDYKWVEGVLTAKHYVAEVSEQKFETLAEAVKAGTQVKLIDNAAAVEFIDATGVTIDLNGYTLEADILATIKMNGGTFKTSEYTMVGENGLYKSDDAVFTISGEKLDVTIISGTMTLNQAKWYTGEGQTLKIEKNAIFVIPEGSELYVNGSNVIVEGIAANYGTLTLANGAHLKGDVAGTIQMAGGTFETSEYVMIGATEGKYISKDAKFTIAADGTYNMTVISGTITLNDADWWTLAGQTLTIAKDAKFVVPAGKNINVQGTVIVDGTAVVDGTVTLYNKTATVKAAAGLNVVTKAGDKVWYTEGKYIVHNHTEAAAVVENFVDSDLNNKGSYDSVIYCSVCGDELSRETVEIPVKEGAVAEVNGIKYATLNEALAAAEAGDTVKLLADVSASAYVVLDKAITLDGNGKTLTSTATRAINVNCAGEVTIKNLTIVGAANTERAINVIQKAATLTLENVTAEGFKYTLNVAASSVGSTITVNGGKLSGYAAVNITGDNTTLVVNDAELVGVNNASYHESNAFAVINIGDETTSETTDNVSGTINGGKLTSISTNGNRQFAVAVSSATEAAVKVDAELVLVDGDVFMGDVVTAATAIFRAEYADELAAQGYAALAGENGLIQVHTHTEEIIPAVDATCTESGLTAGKKCSVCGEILVEQNVINAKGHTEAEAVIENFVDSDLNNKGSYDSVVYCAICGVELTRKTIEVPVKEGAVAEVNGIKYATLAEAVAAGGNIKLLADVTTAPVVLAEGVALDLNGYTVTGTVIGKLILSGGNLITAEGYKMIGSAADYYLTVGGVVVLIEANGDITVESGEIRLAQTWWTGKGQTLTIAENAAFVVPADITLNVNGSTVVVNGQVIIRGTVKLYSADATIQVAEANIIGGQNIVTTAGDKVWYTEGTYIVHDHTVEIIPAVDATCTETGLTEGKKCTVCGDILVAQEVVEAKGHTEEVIPAVDATCTETGLTAGKKCSVCGEILVAQEEIAAKGHTEEIIPGKEATCTETGLTEGKKCSVCGEILVAQEEIAAKGHTEEILPAKDPTCAEAGLTEGKKCSVCGEILVKQEIVYALGHTEEIIPAVEATCTETGLTAGKKCSVCGEITVAQEVTLAKGHSYENASDVTCNVCGAERALGLTVTEDNMLQLADNDENHIYHRVTVYFLGDETVEDIYDEAALKAIDAAAKTYWGAAEINKVELKKSGNYVLVWNYNNGVQTKKETVCVEATVTVDAPEVVLPTLKVEDNKIVLTAGQEDIANYRAVVYYLGNQTVTDINNELVLKAIDPSAQTTWGFNAINKINLWKGGNYVIHLQYNIGKGAKQTIAVEFTVEFAELTLDVVNGNLVAADPENAYIYHRAVVYYVGDELVNPDNLDEVKDYAITTTTYWGLDAINQAKLIKSGNYVVVLEYNLPISPKMTMSVAVTI